MRLSDGLAWANRIVLIALMTALISACAGMEEREPLAGAIQIGDDYYMVPAGADGDGCPQFSPWSSSNPVQAAIYFRKADGSFTLYKEEADCAAD